MDLKNDLEKLLIQYHSKVCEDCKVKLISSAAGVYQCPKCGREYLDDYGKVKHYLEEHGPCSYAEVIEATGVDSEVVLNFLETGKVEIPEGSTYYLSCQSCGCSLKYGRYCPDCMRKTTTDLKTLFSADVGEKPRREVAPEKRGRMHFLGRRKK